MTEKWKEQEWAQDFWYSGKVTRRRFVGWGAGAIGASMLVPAPWAPHSVRPSPTRSDRCGLPVTARVTAVVGLRWLSIASMAPSGVNGRPPGR